MIVDRKVQFDGMVSFLGGQDNGVSPHLLKPDQSFELWNCTVRGSTLAPRPGWFKRELSFETEEMEEWFTTKQVQGCYVYTTKDNTRTVQVWSVGGRFFTVDVIHGNTVQEITPTLNTTTAANFTVPAVGATVAVDVADPDLIRIGYPIKIGGFNYLIISKSGSTLTLENVDDTPTNIIPSGTTVSYLDVNSQNLGICYMIQAEDFLIAQDGFSKPFIFDGGNSRRSMPETNEVPTGTVMAYVKGRVWVAIGGDQYVASDLVYGPSGTDAYNYRDAVLKFTENKFLAGGGSFTAPGTITAMAPMTVLDTSTGQGPLLIFTEQAIVSVDAPYARESWSTVTNPIVTYSLVANGATSFYGTIPTVNGDIFYRSLDGLRSFFWSIRERGSWGNTPLSTELGELIRDDAEELLKYQSAILFDNRLLFTIGSRHTKYGAYWKGMVALDFDTISNMAAKSPPVYDGVWTGIDPTYLFEGMYGRTQRAFVAVRAAGGLNELWEISKKNQFDNDSGRIKWTWVSRGFSFENPLEAIRLENLELFVKEVIGDGDLTVHYRPDDYPCWFSWLPQSVCVNYKRCSTWNNCETPTAFRSGYKTRLPFGQPSDQDEMHDGKPARIGYTHQIKVTCEGFFHINKMRLMGRVPDEDVFPVVDQPEACKTIDCCPDDMFAWRSEGATDSDGDSSCEGFIFSTESGEADGFIGTRIVLDTWLPIGGGTNCTNIQSVMKVTNT